ncbi:hypothetical protein GH714_019815 [Hevea brasiliensis]|uniref:Mediator of RNA polymerase II transcription subunit 25 n=1 Tax=Hevea brasiliensis TaxID=3981 RepID=A0A6A6MF90_HEVBR|nr:hypothetical protein GH714_019815 [Hevea brasiliensis]
MFDIFLQWLAAIPFAGGGFNDAAIAEGLSEALMGKRNIRAADPIVDNVKNPHFLVLISENFMEARASLSRPGVANLPSNQSPVKADVASVTSAAGPAASGCLCNLNASILNRSQISVANVPTATVKVEPTTLTSMAPGPAFSHIPSARPTSQAVPSLQTSSPPTTTQEMITGGENVPDLKPSVSGMPESVRSVPPGAANVSILNNLSQARHVMNSAALTGGTTIVLQSMKQTPVAMHMSNMISSGMASSVPPAQNFFHQEPSLSSITGSGTTQIATNSGLGSFTSATSNISGNSNLGISQPMGNLPGGVSMGPSVPGMSQGNLSGAQMVQSGNGMNQNMMSGLGPSGVSSGSSTMIPTPGMPQQAQRGCSLLV